MVTRANKSTMLAHAALLHDEYNLVLFDFRNHGQSAGDETTQGALEQNDLRAVVDWLDRRKGTGADRAAGALHGWRRVPGRVDCRRPDRRRHPGLDPRHRRPTPSRPGWTRTATRSRCPASWSILLGSLIRTGEDISAVDPVQRVAHYGEGRPLLIIEGGQDDLIGPTDADDLLAAAQDAGADAQLKICLPAGHGESLEACAGEYRDWVLGFLTRSLAP